MWLSRALAGKCERINLLLELVSMARCVGFLILVCAAGCSNGPDGGIDIGIDAGIDTAIDAGIDTAIDAGIDTAIDAGIDSDASMDGGTGSEWTIDPEGYDDLHNETLDLLANPCDIDDGAGTMTLSVRGGETAYVKLRLADNMVVTNGQTGGMAECAVPTTYNLEIAEDAAHPGVERVFLDYENGPFAVGSVSEPGVTVALRLGSSLVVRGSSGADKMHLGSTYASSVLDHSFININDDGSPDVQFDGVTEVEITTGPDADIISADGGNGTTGLQLDATIAFSAYGGGGADTLTGGKGPSTLAGGDENDLFLQTLTIAADNIVGGNGADTVDYGMRTTAVSVTVCSTCVAAPPDSTIAACNVCVRDDGAAGEGDTINDDVELVLGGTGNDTLSAQWARCSDGAATPTLLCTLEGNNGDDTLNGSPFADLIEGGNNNDTLKGGLGSDTLIGDAGVDTVSYAERTNPVSVSLDAAQLWVTGQNGEAGENDAIASDVENLTGGLGNDFLRGSSSANIIRGGAGSDTIEGGLGNDAMYGDAENDLIYGSTGNDLLMGGPGIDTLVGGDGDDFLDAADSPATADTVIDCDGVNDSSSTAGTSPGTADALVKDGSDTGQQHCEL